MRLVDGKPVLRDGRPVPPVGEWLEETGDIRICERGLHGSWRALDALQYLEWEGGAVCLVDVDGVAAEHADKFVCSRRRVLAWMPCDEALRLFARQAALSVAHLWPGMPAVVREYLETGLEEIRAAAWDAARDAAWDAAWAAARDAARDAAWDAARSAARDAARAAARSAARADLNQMLEGILLHELDWHPGGAREGT